MSNEFPGLLYCAGALIAVASWALFMFSKKFIGKDEQYPSCGCPSFGYRSS